MVLMHHLNADPGVEEEEEAGVNPCGESMHGIWNSDVRGVEYQMFKSLSEIS